MLAKSIQNQFPHAGLPGEFAPSLEEADRTFGGLVMLAERDPIEMRHAVRSAAYNLNHALWSARSSGQSPAAIGKRVPLSRELYRSCAFIDRISTWPRGYRGDFETIQSVLSLENPYPRTDVRHYIQHYVLECPLSQQHRNKVHAQSLEVVSALMRKGNAKVLSVACGACPDIEAVLPLLPPSDHRFVIADQDEDALARSREVFARAGREPIVVNGNVFRRLPDLVEHGPYDLVLIGGLFDYLELKPARRLLAHVINRLLVDDGVLFWTNIADRNPYAAWMECIADWPLIERSDEDILGLIADAGPAAETTIRRDDTGLTSLVTIRLRRST